MEILLDEIGYRAQGEHQVNERRDQGQKDLENKDVGQRDPTQNAFAGEYSTMLPYRLQDSE